MLFKWTELISGNSSVWNSEHRFVAALSTFQVCNLQQVISILCASLLQLQNECSTLVYLIAEL